MEAGRGLAPAAFTVTFAATSPRGPDNIRPSLNVCVVVSTSASPTLSTRK